MHLRFEENSSRFWQLVVVIFSIVWCHAQPKGMSLILKVYLLYFDKSDYSS